MRQVAVIVLAAGQGTRMKSDLHKVLHPIAGRPMLLHLLASAAELTPAQTVVVAGARREQIEAAVAPLANVTVALQEPQLGTGHAVLQAQPALADFDGDVLILYGDVPFVTVDTMRLMLDRLYTDDTPAVVVLGFEPFDALHYGRVIAWDDGQITKMVEFKDATAEEQAFPLCNSGLLAAKASDLFALLHRVTNDNAAEEYYLPDIVNIAIADGRRCVVVTTEEFEVMGINSRSQLEDAEGQWQMERRTAAMADGATLIASDTVWFAWDTKIGRDVLIEPNVFFGPGVTVADGAIIRAFSHIEGAVVGAGAEVGPFARLRPGAVLGEKAKVGNFVEVKKTKMGAGAKANHLTYLGDAEVGAGANVGAGTITCNYDGFFKYKTEIGAGAFVGSNSALVAPVTIGPGAIVAAGSVITADVAPDALAVARGKQESKPGWAKGFRTMMAGRKKS